MKFLLYLRQHYPSLYDQPPKFGIDLFEILDRQVKIHKKLMSLSEFRQLKTRHRIGQEGIRIQIKKKKDRNDRSSPLISELIGILNNSIHDYHDYHDDHEQKSDKKENKHAELSIVDRIAEESRQLTINMERVWKTYIKLGPQSEDDIRNFFQATYEEKRNIIGSYLYKEKINSQFSRAPRNRDFFLGLDLGKSMDVHEFLMLLDRNERAYQALKKWVQIFVLTQKRNPHEALEVLKRMKARIPAEYYHKEGFRSKLGPIRKLLGSNFDPFEDTRKEIMKNKLLTTSKEEGESVYDWLCMEEVPPFVGIFRGHAGRDCATLYSFPYPNDPNEKVLFLYDREEREEMECKKKAGEECGINEFIKGYINGTILDVHGKRCFYLHTIAGEKLTKEETKMIIYGLYASREFMGVQEIILPTSRQVSFLFNCKHTRQQVESFIRQQEKVPMEYLNEGIRHVLDETVTANYDRITSNTHGHVFKVRPLKEEKWEVKWEKKEFPEFKETRRINNAEVLSLALDLKFMGRMDTARRALRGGRISSQEFKSLCHELNNAKKLRVKDYLKRLAKTFEKLQMDFNEDFFQKKSYYFSRGILRAKDSMTPPYRETTVIHLIHILQKKNMRQNKEVGSFIIQYKHFLLKNPRFLKYVHSLLEGKNSRGHEGPFKFLFLYNLKIFNEEIIGPLLEKLLKEQNLKTIREDFSERQKIGIKGQIIFKLLENFNPWPGQYYQKMEGTLRFIIERSDPITLNHFLKSVAPFLKTPQAEDLREILKRKRCSLFSY